MHSNRFLHLAATTGILTASAINANAADIILEMYGADINVIENVENKNILDMAINLNYPKGIITFLRKYGAKIAKKLQANKDKK